MKSVFTQAFDLVEPSEQKKQETINKLINYNRTAQANDTVKTKKRFVWNIKRAMIAVSTVAVLIFCAVFFPILINNIDKKPKEPSPPDTLGADYAMMSFKKYGEKVYFINALDNSYLYTYDLTSGVLLKNDKIKKGYHHSGIHYNALEVADGKIFYVSDTAIYQADLNGNNNKKIYESVSWASLSNLNFLDGKLYFAETSQTYQWGANSQHKVQVSAKVIELDIKTAYARTLVDKTVFFAYDIYEYTDWNYMFAYQLFDGKLFYSLENIYELDLTTLESTVILETEYDIFSAKVNENFIYYVEYGEQLTYNRYDMVSKEIVPYTSKFQQDGSYASLMLFLNDLEETLYAVDSSNTYERVIKVENIVSGEIISIFSPDSSMLRPHYIEYGYTFDGILAFFDREYGIVFYYNDELIRINEPDSVLYRYEAKSVSELETYVGAHIYQFTQHPWIELQTRKYYSLTGNMNKQKTQGNFTAYYIFYAEINGKLTDVDIAFMGNIMSYNADLPAFNSSNDFGYSIVYQTLSTLNGNTVRITKSTHPMYFYYIIDTIIDGWYYQIQIASQGTITTADLETLAKSLK